MIFGEDINNNTNKSDITPTNETNIISDNNNNRNHDDDDDDGYYVYGENILSLEAALDWLCFHLQSDDLPKLFTDINLRQDEKNKNRNLNLSVIQASRAEEEEEEKLVLSNENVHVHVGEKEKAKKDNFIVLKRDGSGGDDSGGDDNSDNNKATKKSLVDNHDKEKEAAKKAWLLSQYQYEDWDGDEDENSVNEDPESRIGIKIQNEGELVDKGTGAEAEAETGTGTGTENVVKQEREKFPEEIRLESLENEIRDLTESLNDEASNYMRSKYEIAEMKKNLKKLQGQAKGLRGKVAKKIASLEIIRDREKEDEEKEKKGEAEEEEEEGCAVGLFDSLPLLESTVTTVQYIDVNIPKDWSGKTPKVMLLEHCRKQKWPKPAFSKMENSTNGCVVKVKQLQNDVKIVADEGPFRSIADAEHYVSTKALYELNHNLPMYLLMPPDFRDVWTSWLKEKEAKRKEALMVNENERSEKISALVSYLSDVVNEAESKNNGSKRILPLGGNLEDETKDIAENWDEESSCSNKSTDEIIRTLEASKIQTAVPNNVGKALRDSFVSKQKRQSYEKMYRSRQCLPIFDYRQQILDTVRNNSVTVLCAETGKT